MDHRTNSDYFHYTALNGFYTRGGVCLLRGTNCIFIVQVNLSLERVNKMCLVGLERRPWFQMNLSPRSLVMVLTRSMIIDGLTLCFGTRTCTLSAKMTLRPYPEYSVANYFLSRNNYQTINKSREQPGGNTRKGNTINNRSNSTFKNNQSTISIITKPIFNFPLRHMQQRLKSWGCYQPLDDLMSELHLHQFCTKEGPTCVVVHTKFNLLI